jgi:polar amino acid transport system substrate-binding protein
LLSARWRFGLFTLLCAFSLAGTPACARQNGNPLKVATLIAPPFGMNDNGKLTGFSIDLWQAIADQLKMKYAWTVQPNVKVLLASVQSGRSDLGISNISITSERDKIFDFSHPIYDGGLQIMTRSQSEGTSAAVLSALRNFFTLDMLKLFGLILLLIVIMANIVWFVERHYEDRGVVKTKRYFPGIFLSGWWAASTLATQAEELPKSPLGRIIAVFWMFTSVVFVAYFTAQITASLTVQTLQGTINGPNDLPGKKVATTIGSTSALYLKEHGIQVQTFSQLADVYDALDTKKVDAVVFDSPVLLYYAAHDGKGKAQVVGPIFQKESYGIVFPSNSPLRRPVNLALLTLQENGTYDTIYNKWFASSDNKQNQ